MYYSHSFLFIVQICHGTALNDERKTRVPPHNELGDTEKCALYSITSPATALLRDEHGNLFFSEFGGQKDQPCTLVKREQQAFGSSFFL